MLAVSAGSNDGALAKWHHMNADSTGTEALAASQVRRGSKLTWYAYLDRLFIAFGAFCLAGSALILML